jgi:hypothetical protein
VCITLAESGGLFYVLDVQRKQVQAPVFGAQVAAVQKVREASRRPAGTTPGPSSAWRSC